MVAGDESGLKAGLRPGFSVTTDDDEVKEGGEVGGSVPFVKGVPLVFTDEKVEG